MSIIGSQAYDQQKLMKRKNLTALNRGSYTATAVKIEGVFDTLSSKNIYRENRYRDIELLRTFDIFFPS